jgi:hypothetical protein
MEEDWGRTSTMYKVLARKPEGKTPLGRPKHRWDDVKINLRERGVKWWTGLSDSGCRQAVMNVVSSTRQGIS